MAYEKWASAASYPRIECRSWWPSRLPLSTNLPITDAGFLQTSTVATTRLTTRRAQFYYLVFRFNGTHHLITSKRVLHDLGGGEGFQRWFLYVTDLIFDASVYRLDALLIELDRFSTVSFIASEALGWCYVSCEYFLGRQNDENLLCIDSKRSWNQCCLANLM